MNAFELYHADGRKTGIWACGKCRIVHREERGAALCCEPKVCDRCGANRPENYLYCPSCRPEVDEERRAARWDKATKLPRAEYDGPVWDDDTDQYYSSPGAFEDDWYDSHDSGADGYTPPPITARVYACKPFRFKFDALRLIEHALEDHHDDARDEIADGAVNELQAALDAWCDKHSPTSYYQDTETAIVWGPMHVPKHRQETPQ